MVRNYGNNNILQRKDSRYTVSVTNHGHRTYFYGKAKRQMLQSLKKIKNHRFQIENGGFLGSPCWTRTNDLRINSPSLYRLS